MSGVHDIAALRSRIVEAILSSPGTLPDPAPEALISDLSDVSAGNLKIRVRWSTQASRQHQMLTSYDAVLTAIERALAQKRETDNYAAQNNERDRAA